MPKLRLFLLTIFSFFINSLIIAQELQECRWDNRKGMPCIVVSKTPNTSILSESGVNKIIITKEYINKIGAIDVVDVLETIEGIDLKQNGQKGQLTSLFMRGTNSNHTLVLLNGIPINDQSTTQGLHNFGQDFIQTLQQIEIYKGPSGAHFGPSAIGGAINFVTSIDYTNKFSISGFDGKNNSLNGNYAKVFENDWHVNVKGSRTNSKNGSSRYGGDSGREEDGAKNYQINLIAEKWINNNLKYNSNIYSRKTKTHYDASASDETGYADDKMHVIQSSLNKINKNSEDLIIFHYNNYDREYDESGYFDEYNSETFLLKLERKKNFSKNFSFGYGSEYKYDSAEFTNNGSWSTPSAKGNVDNFGLFANLGYQYSEDTILSFYGRSDKHKTTGFSPTYKVNLSKFINKFKFGITHSTGLRNPSLYELYGNNGRTDTYKHVANPDADPEKSKSNELKIKYFFSDAISLENTFYRTSINNALLYNSNFNGGTGYTNSQSKLKQDGIETNLVLIDDNQKFSFYNTISSSKKINGDHQLNRPDSTYGINYTKKFKNNLFGPFSLNYNYKHYGKVFDYAPSIKKVDSTDIMNLSLSKNTVFGSIFFNITNLLDEKYQRPYGYSQDGRNFRIGLRTKF